MIETATLPRVSTNETEPGTSHEHGNQPIDLDSVKGNVLPLVRADHPLLATKLEPYVFDASTDALLARWQLVADLIETMQSAKGVGLSANQVGRSERVFVIEVYPPIALWNPTIIDSSEDEAFMEEGCLTYPGLYCKVKRPKSVRIRYTDTDGETHTQVLSGMTARVFQHEIGHMNGERFFDNANRFHREQAFRQFRRKR